MFIVRLSSLRRRVQRVHRARRRVRCLQVVPDYQGSMCFRLFDRPSAKLPATARRHADREGSLPPLPHRVQSVFNAVARQLQSLREPEDLRQRLDGAQRQR